MKNIERYEAIAKLDLPEEERKWISDVADKLAESFKVLSEVDVSGAEPLVSVLGVQNILREDISAKMIERDELLSDAPEQYDGYFQVPKTLD